MIRVSVNVSLIDKSRFYVKKDGSKVLDLVLIESPNNKYGDDYLVKQGISKEERDSNQRPDMPILGNAKIFENRSGGGRQQQQRGQGYQRPPQQQQQQRETPQPQGNGGGGDDW